MKPIIAATLATAGGVIAFRCLPSKVRNRLTAKASHRMLMGMQRMMASLPEDAPPRLIVSILPKLQAQNEQIITMLREQNALLREQQRNVR